MTLLESIYVDDRLKDFYKDGSLEEFHEAIYDCLKDNENIVNNNKTMKKLVAEVDRVKANLDKVGMTVAELILQNDTENHHSERLEQGERKQLKNR